MYESYGYKDMLLQTHIREKFKLYFDLATDVRICPIFRTNVLPMKVIIKCII